MEKQAGKVASLASTASLARSADLAVLAKLAIFVYQFCLFHFFTK